MGREDTETMDEVFGGTEEQLKRTYNSGFNAAPLKLSDILFVAHVKMWLQDGLGKGFLGTKSVLVVTCFFVHRFRLISCETAVVMPE